MKPLESSLLALAMGIFGSLLISGCYTQLAITSDEPAEADHPEPTSIYQPPPTAVVLEGRIFLPVEIQNSPLPVAATASSGSAARPQSTSEHRETGNQRTASSSTTRTGGLTRSGR